MPRSLHRTTEPVADPSQPCSYDVGDRRVEFVSLTEQVDTTTPSGKLIFHFMGVLAEFERDLGISRATVYRYVKPADVEDST